MSSTRIRLRVSDLLLKTTVRAMNPTLTKGINRVPRRKLRLNTRVRHSRAMTAPINPPFMMRWGLGCRPVRPPE